MHFSAAAASTPSGAPPEPMYMSMPVFSGSAQWMTPATSPSVISRMRGAGRADLVDHLLVARALEHADVDLVGPRPWRSASAWMRSAGRHVEVDEAVG